MLTFAIVAIAFASHPLDSPAVAHPQGDFLTYAAAVCATAETEAFEVIGDGPQRQFVQNMMAELSADEYNLLPHFDVNKNCLKVGYALTLLLTEAPGLVENFVGALGVLTTALTVHQALGRTMYAVHLDLAPEAVDKIAWINHQLMNTYYSATGLTSASGFAGEKTFPLYCSFIQKEYDVLFARVSDLGLADSLSHEREPLAMTRVCDPATSRATPVVMYDWEQHQTDYKSAHLQGEAYSQAVTAHTFYHWESLFVAPIADLIPSLLATGSTSAVQPAMQLYRQSFRALENATVAWRARHTA